MNPNILQNATIADFLLKESGLLASGPAQTPVEAPKTTNNIIVLSSDDDDNSTPKSRAKSLKSSGPTMKRTHSQLTEKAVQRRSTKSILNSNFSLEDQPEPESAETDFNSPVATSQRIQAAKLKQQQKLSSSSQRKISQITQINSSNNEEDNTLRKKSFFEELEEIAFSSMQETNKKVKVDDSISHSSSQQSSSSNLISLYPSFNQPSSQTSLSQQQLIQQQHQFQIQQHQLHPQQLSLIQEVAEEEQSNNQQLKSRKQPQKQQRAPRVATKKQEKVNSKSKQRGRKNTQQINETASSTINYQNSNSANLINNNCANPQINFPIQPKTILLNQNTTKFQEVPKKIQPPRAVFAEEVYLKSISQEGSIKLQKFPCFRESDLSIPSEFSNLIQQQYSDDDKCSGDELLEKAVNYMHKKLVAATVEQNPSASIPDAEKTFTIRDIKIDRDSEEEEEEEEENQYSSNSYKYSPYGRQSNHYSNNNNNNFLSDDEEDDDDN